MRASFKELLGSLLVMGIHAYRWVLSPAKNALLGGPSCRFTPTCSLFAMDAIRAHGPGMGTVLALRRVCRCHPWTAGGHDQIGRAHV